MNKILIFLFVLLFSGFKAYPQPDNMSKEEWEFVRDQYAVQIIKLMVALEGINTEVDSLNKAYEYLKAQCERSEDEMYALVGMTKNSIQDFRKKFEETEKRVNSRTGTPADARQNYFDEISSSRAACLPEFSDRFASMKKKLVEWEGQKPPEHFIAAGTYTVVKGDCLWKIASMRLGSPYYWPAIWDANKNRIVNPEYFYEEKHRAVSDPALVYPGQVLKIPLLSEEDKRRLQK